MKEKAEKFLSALKHLCKQHGVVLSVSDYDGLQIWDFKEGDDPIHCTGIEDRTGKDN